MAKLSGAVVAALALFAGSGPALAVEMFPATDPRSVVQAVIALTDRHKLPSWDQQAFFVKTRPYLTDELRAVVAKGGKIAVKKHINLWDGDFFTGSQSVEHAKLFDAAVTKLQGDSASVEASIGVTDDPKAEPTIGGKSRFDVKRVAGTWKIDDIVNLEDYAKTFPSMKTRFSDPVKYAE